MYANIHGKKEFIYKVLKEMVSSVFFCDLIHCESERIRSCRILLHVVETKRQAVFNEVSYFLGWGSLSTAYYKYGDHKNEITSLSFCCNGGLIFK